MPVSVPAILLEFGQPQRTGDAAFARDRSCSNSDVLNPAGFWAGPAADAKLSFPQPYYILDQVCNFLNSQRPF